jgi:TP901 family phage tail tape measure protein
MSSDTDTIKLKIQVQDDGSVVITNIQQKIKHDTQKIKKSFDLASMGLKQWAVNTMKFTGLYHGMSGVIRGVTNSIKGLWNAAKGFQTDFADVTTLFDVSKVNVAGLREEIFKMAGPLGNISELAKSAYQAISAGRKPAEAIRYVGDNAIFAKAAVTNLKTSVELNTATLNAYGLGVDKLGYIHDTFFRIIEKGVTTGPELSGSLGQVIPTAATLGVGIKELGGALATLTKGGISTSEAVTALNRMLLELLTPGTKAVAVAKGLKDAAGNVIEFSRAGVEAAGGLHAWLMKLKEAVGGNVEKFGELFQMAQAQKAVMVLTGAQAKEYTNIMREMEDVSGATRRAFEKQMKTFHNQWEGLKNKVQAIMVKNLLPVLKSAAEWIKENSNKIEEFVKTAISKFKDVVKFIIKFKDVIILAGKAWLAYFAVSKVVSWGAAFFTVLTRASGMLSSLGTSLVKMTAAFRLAKTFGVGTFGAIRSSILSAIPATSKLISKLGSLKSVLAKLPLVGGAFAVGWGVGKLADNALGISEKLQKSYDKLNPQILYDKMSQAKTGITDYSTSMAELTRNIITVGNQLGVTSRSLTENSYAIKQNKQFYDLLPPTLQDLIDKHAEVIEKRVEEKRKTDELNATLKKYRDEALMMITLQLRMLNLPTPDFFRKSIKDELAAIKTLREKMADLATEYGVFTGKHLEELKQKQTLMLKIWKKHKDEILKNEDATRAFNEDLKLLAATLGNKLNPEIEKLIKLSDTKPKYPRLGIIDIPDSFQESVKESIDQGREFEETLKAIGTAGMLGGDGLEYHFNKNVDDGTIALYYYNAALDRTKEINRAAAGGVNELGQMFVRLAESIGLSDEAASIISQTISSITSGLTAAAQGDIAGVASAAFGNIVSQLEAAIGAFIDDIAPKSIEDWIEEWTEAIEEFGAGSLEVYEILQDIKAEGLEIGEILDYQREKIHEGLESLSDYYAYAATSQKRFTRGLIYTMAIFSGLISSGYTFVEAIREMKDEFGELLDIIAETGYTADESFQFLLNIADFIEQNEALANALSAVGNILNSVFGSGAYSISQRQTVIYTVGADLTDMYQEAIGAGATKEEAYALLADPLNDLIFYATEHNLKIDSQTASLIAEMQAAGYLTELQLPEDVKQTMLLEEMLKIMGGVIPYLLSEINSSILQEVHSGAPGDDQQPGGQKIIKEYGTGGEFWTTGVETIKVGEGPEIEHVKITPKSQYHGEQSTGGGDMGSRSVAIHIAGGINVHGARDPEALKGQVAIALSEALDENVEGVSDKIYEIAGDN